MYRRSTGQIISISDDLYDVHVRIRLSYKNVNYVGTLFGGSMAASTDPIFMIQLISILGDNYVVWDKAVEIKFKRPAKETAFVHFHFNQEEIEQIKLDVLEKNEIDIKKKANITNKDGSVVFAEVTKTIYIAKKQHYLEKRRTKATTKN